mgnify:CR=1 FL=1
MILLLQLVLAHLIGDFLIQPTAWVKEKKRLKIAAPQLYLHVLVHGLLVFALTNSWETALVVLSIHYLIDLAKLYFQEEKTERNWFFFDQLLHLLSLLVIWIIFENPKLQLTAFNQQLLLIYSTALVLISYPTALILKQLLSIWSPSAEKEGEKTLANAGQYIGIIERILVFVFIVTNHWEAIGFLLAAKSVFRFGDLKRAKDRRLTEYILVGTLLSFGVAIFISMATLYLLGKAA